MAGALPPVVAELLATNSEFMAKMAESKAAMEDVSKSGGSSFAKLSSVGGTLLAGLAGGVVAVGVASVAMEIKFQSAMEMIHTQAGASQAEVNKMSAAVLNLAGSVGTGPDELAAGLYHIESAGLRGAKALNILKIAAEGAKVGHADLEDVTNALDGAIVSGIKGVQNYGQAMGSLNAIVGAGDMRMQDLANAMGTGIAATAKTAGLSLTDVGAALAVFGDNNIRGSKAAIYTRQAITAMVAPSKNAQFALSQIGLGATQLGEDLRKPDGLVVAMQTLKEHLDATGMDATEQAAVLARAFGGARTSTGVEILMSQLTRLKSKYADIQKGANDFGTDWTATTKTTQFQLDQLGATLEATGVKIGAAILPKLESLAKDAEQVVIWFEKNKTAAEALGIALGGVAAVAITAFAIDKISGWVNSIKSAVTWMTNLGNATKVTAGEQADLDVAQAGGGAGAAAKGAGVTAGETGEGAAVGGGSLAAGIAAPLAAILVPALVANHFLGGTSAKTNKQNEANVAQQGDYSVQGVMQVLTKGMGVFSASPKQAQQMIAAMEKQGLVLGQTRSLGEAAAKDKSIQTVSTLITGLRAEVNDSTAKNGAYSKTTEGIFNDLKAAQKTATQLMSAHMPKLESIDSKLSHEVDIYNTARQAATDQKELTKSMSKVNTDTAALRTLLSGGITITKEPQKTTKAHGSITLKVS